MKKLLVFPICLLLVPQAISAAFFGAAHFVLGHTDWLGQAWMGISGAVLAASAIGGLVSICDELPKYHREQALLAEQRRLRMERLEAEIGIPPISRIR